MCGPRLDPGLDKPTIMDIFKAFREISVWTAMRSITYFSIF